MAFIVLRVLGWAILGSTALCVAASAAIFAWLAVGFSPLEDEPIPWVLVSGALVLAVAGVLGAAACGRAAVNGASRSMRQRR